MLMMDDTRTLLRLADWIYHAGPNLKGEFPVIDASTVRRIAMELDEANRCWKGSLEVQADLESQLEKMLEMQHDLEMQLEESRQYAQRLRVELEAARQL